MPILRVFFWALLFLLRLRFPPGTSVARRFISFPDVSTDLVCLLERPLTGMKGQETKLIVMNDKIKAANIRVELSRDINRYLAPSNVTFSTFDSVFEKGETRSGNQIVQTEDKTIKSRKKAMATIYSSKACHKDLILFIYLLNLAVNDIIIHVM